LPRKAVLNLIEDHKNIEKREALKKADERLFGVFMELLGKA